MPHFIIRPDAEQRPYTVKFHVRAPARCTPDEFQQRFLWSLERMIGRLAQQGWGFLRLSDQAPRGPLPVVPIKGFPKRPPRLRRKPGQPSVPEPKDDALWRVSTLPTFGPQAAHLMTDEVDWEYSAIFSRPAITTEYVAPDARKGEPEPLWLKR